MRPMAFASATVFAGRAARSSAPVQGRRQFKEWPVDCDGVSHETSNEKRRPSRGRLPRLEGELTSASFETEPADGGGARPCTSGAGALGKMLLFALIEDATQTIRFLYFGRAQAIELL